MYMYTCMYMHVCCTVANVLDMIICVHVNMYIPTGLIHACLGFAATHHQCNSITLLCFYTGSKFSRYSTSYRWIGCHSAASGKCCTCIYMIWTTIPLATNSHTCISHWARCQKMKFTQCVYVAISIYFITEGKLIYRELIITRLHVIPYREYM